ncbi:uncharacterized protein LOC113508341 [Trichoplusia ni]|uniref:Uncharacterized protein LOC113508341 n=1 Tax=Trichoplusia ni TaxID=7111 RepID=A0A7E5X3Z5_TRINI|nr:uncharacterized protein LOC113508341 [Trichoplusia ni]
MSERDGSAGGKAGGKMEKKAERRGKKKSKVGLVVAMASAPVQDVHDDEETVLVEELCAIVDNVEAEAKKAANGLGKADGDGNPVGGESGEPGGKPGPEGRAKRDDVPDAIPIGKAAGDAGAPKL